MCHSGPDHPDQYVLYCFPLLMTTYELRKGQPLGKLGWAGQGSDSLLQKEFVKALQQEEKRGNDLWEWTQTQDKNSEL